MPHLYQELEKYSHSDYYPYHMPGHKRQQNSDFLKDAYKMDITEIDGFDNLHDAQGIIKEAEERAACLYHSEETHFLINGSTCGILTAISAVVRKGDTLLMSRNCHKAVYHAVLLNELKPVYLYPDIVTAYDLCGGITAGQVEKAVIENPAVKAVMITSPSYDGVVSDIKGIAEVAHAHGIPLLVDEAHGAHFGFSDKFPKSAVEQGADIVIHSVHKTLPAFTQTALLHVNGRLINRERVKKYLGIYQSSSPSYLLMAGIDYCMELLEKEGNSRFLEFAENLSDFYKKAFHLEHLELVTEQIKGKNGVYDFDRGKLIISTKKTDISGKELYERLLNEYHLQAEMAAGSYCLMIMTIMDTKEGYFRLLEALFEIDRELGSKTDNEIILPICRSRAIMSISEASEYEKKWVSLAESIGMISAETIFLYPPGIPLIVPGEEISEGLYRQLLQNRKTGLNVCGLNPENEEEIAVIWEKSIISLEKVQQEKTPYIKE